MENIAKVMEELAQYKRMHEETAAIIEGLQNILKEYMLEEGREVVSSGAHKATYKDVVTRRLDSIALKAEQPEVAARYTRETSVKRFVFS